MRVSAIPTLNRGKLLFYLLTAALGLTGQILSADQKATAPTFPGASWKYVAAPANHGWSPSKLSRAAAFAEQIGSAAVMAVDNGMVLAAWGPVDHRFPLHSIRKPLLSALVGIHVGEGRIDIARSLEDLGIEDCEPVLTAAEKQATLADLLKSRSGVYHPALGEVAAMKRSRPQRGSHRPGTFWYYNNWDFNAVGTIFEQETGTRIFDELDRRIAGPLGMQDFIVRDGVYITGPESVHRVYALRMSTRDLARFGLLYLRRGYWWGQTIVPSAWVEESTAAHSAIGRGRGYGYMWRTAVGEGLAPNVRLPVPCFFHSGAGLHFLIVIPAFDLVVVHRVDTYRQGPYPSPPQIGRLFWMILDARGIRGIGADPSLEGAVRTPLKEKRIMDVLLASRLQVSIPNGLVEGGDQVFIADFETDGTMRLTPQNRAAIQGTWHVSDDRCCVDIDGLKDCYYVTENRNQVGFYDTTQTLYTLTTKLR